MSVKIHPAPNWTLKSGYTQAIIWSPDTGDVVATPMVAGGVLFNETTERRVTGAGTLDERSRVNSIAFTVSGDVQAETIRQWANRAGTPSRVNAILLGRGRSYQFLEDVPCVYDAVDADFGSFSGDTIILHTEKFSPSVYQSTNLLANLDWETDWAGLTGGTRTSSYNPVTAVWTMGASGSTRQIVYVDKVIPAKSTTLYFSGTINTLTGSPTTAQLLAIPLNHEEVITPVAFGAEATVAQTETITGAGRFELAVVLPPAAYGVRLAFDMTSPVGAAEMKMRLPLLTVKPTITKTIDTTPLLTYGINGSDQGGSGTRLRLVLPTTVVDNGDDTHTLTIPDDAFISYSTDGLAITIKTDNDWTQP